jgi:hypothetical protein
MENLAKKTKKLWEKGQPFFIEATAYAPYDGCHYEPNIFLVTPIGCAEQMKLMWNIPVYHAADQVTRLVQPQLCVWPLYAVGQGEGLDAIHSLDELLQYVAANQHAEESSHRTESLLRKLATRSGLEGTRSEHASKINFYCRLRIEQIVTLGPINEVLHAAERYWMAALDRALELGLTCVYWKCSKCGKDASGVEEERPEPTGYHGDGGIGIHYVDVMCQECADKGMCEVCREHGDYMTYYDSAVAENGWSLCADHAKDLLRGALTGEVPTGKRAWLVWYSSQDQLALQGIAPTPELVLLVDGVQVKTVILDVDMIAERAEGFRLDALDSKYSINVGVVFDTALLEDLVADAE